MLDNTLHRNLRHTNTTKKRRKKRKQEDDHRRYWILSRPCWHPSSYSCYTPDSSIFNITIIYSVILICLIMFYMRQLISWCGLFLSWIIFWLFWYTTPSILSKSSLKISSHKWKYRQYNGNKMTNRKVTVNKTLHRKLNWVTRTH
jgi:hypothetical protein